MYLPGSHTSWRFSDPLPVRLMASPIFQSFCCADGSFVLYGNSSEGVSLSADDVAFLCYNIICVVSSTAGVSGCLYQLVKRTPRCLGCRSTADNALLLLVQNNIIACLAAADLLAALGAYAEPVDTIVYDQCSDVKFYSSLISVQ